MENTAKFSKYGLIVYRTKKRSTAEFPLGNSCVFANFGLRRNSSAEPFRNETIAKTVSCKLKTRTINEIFTNYINSIFF